MQETKKETKISNLNADELLRIVLQLLRKTLDCRIISFPEKISAVILDDLNVRRIRQGLITYERALICQINGKTWAICIGKCDSNTSYSGNIIAVEISSTEFKISKKISEEIQTLIQSENQLRYALITACHDGQLLFLGNTKNRFNWKLYEAVTPILALNVCTGISPVPTTYKPEFAKVLADMIAKILKNESNK